MSTVPEPITRASVLSMSPEDLKKIVSNPAKLAEYNAFLASDEGRNVLTDLVTEELAQPEPDAPVVTQEAIDEAAAAAAVLHAEAETIRLAEEARQATILAAEAAKPKKIVVEYQATDENGQPIGRPTHLEAYSWEEMSEKQREAHIQATRAFHRLKTQKTTFNKKPDGPIAIPDVPLMSEADRIQAALDLNSNDEDVVVKADRKLRADQILRDQKKEAIDREETRQKDASKLFLEAHQNDFNPCQANAAIIARYIKDNDLAWTVDNLELAFAATEPQLAQVVLPVVEVPVPEVDNPPAASQVTPAAPPVAAITPAPVVVAPVVPAAPVPADNPPVPARRPGVNGGLQPDQLSAQRPILKPVGLTMKEIHDWSGEQMRKERKNPARSAEIDRVILAYNKARQARI